MILSLTTFNATPSVAYRINDWISVGAGVQIEYAKAQFNHNVTVPTGVPFPPIVALGDGNLGGDGWGYGFTAGVTLTPTPTTTVGLGYRSAINQKISGTLALPPQLGGSFAASTTLNLPEMVSRWHPAAHRSTMDFARHRRVDQLEPYWDLRYFSVSAARYSHADLAVPIQGRLVVFGRRGISGNPIG